MTIRLEHRERRGFSKAEFEPLALHYKGQVLQIHVMVEFAERGLAAMSEALRLAMDYFTLKEEEFLARWLPGRDREIGRQTTPESWRAIVESLKNPVQQRIVADDREQANVLVLAGPGSGKPVYWCIALLIWFVPGGKKPAAFWPWPTTVTRRSISAAASKS